MPGPLKRAYEHPRKHMTDTPIFKPKAETDSLPMFDTRVDFDQDRTTNDLIIKQHQYIPDNFMSDLKSNKMDSARQRSGEMMLALTVPVSVIEDMKLLYNFDAMSAPIKEVKAMLQRMQLDAFIATNKRI